VHARSAVGAGQIACCGHAALDRHGAGDHRVVVHADQHRAVAHPLRDADAMLLAGGAGRGAQDAQRLGGGIVAAFVHVGGETAKVDERERASDAAAGHEVVSRASGMLGGALR
jgi:hypothetical protein